MGGAAGHMNHPFDLGWVNSGSELIDFFVGWIFLTGEKETFFLSTLKDFFWALPFILEMI